VVRTQVERASEIRLSVLARGDHLPGETSGHPVRADLGVEVDVDLVLVDQDLVVGQTLDHLSQRRETPTTLAGRERAEHHRTWSATSGADQAQRPRHGRHGDHRPGAAGERPHQELASPGRPGPAVLVRPVSQDLREVGEEVVVDLARAVLGAAVDEAGRALRAEPMDRAHDRRW
jgi:hypothetical protein